MESIQQGGYRLTGQSPAKQAGLPVISVITVVYNSLSLIEKTISSILSQTYPNIEYIVIDGGSSDGTAEIIRVYEERISWWISEPDRGIYDAMNKGLAAATGDYVWFMNAGDRIYRDDTLEEIITGAGSEPVREYGSFIRAKIYYGDTMIVDPQYREVGLRRLRPPEVLTWKSFKKGMLVCHQAIIVGREIAEPFDPQYRHSADFDWVVRALKKAQGSSVKAQGASKAPGSRRRKQGARIKEQDSGMSSTILPDLIPGATVRSGLEGIVNTHQILCAFLDGGHSKHNIAISLRERFHSMVRHYGLIPTFWRHIPIAIRFGWFYLMHKRF